MSISCASALLLFLLSWWSWHLPLVGAIATSIILFATIFAFSRSLYAGTSIVLWELVIGSFGHELGNVMLFHVPPLRMGLCGIAMVAMLVACMKQENRKILWSAPLFLRASFLAVIVAVASGAMIGLMQHGFLEAMNDANAYAYFLLAPLFLLALRTEDEAKRYWSIVAGGVIATSILTIFLALYFTHGATANITSDVYRWIRDFGFGELTPNDSGFVRVFLQSQFWGALLFVGLLTAQAQKKISPMDVLLALCFLLMILSQSRTLWSGIAVACIAGLLCFVFQKKTCQQLHICVVHRIQ